MPPMKHLALICLLCLGSILGATTTTVNNSTLPQDVVAPNVQTNGTAADAVEPGIPEVMSNNKTNSQLPNGNRTSRIWGGDSVQYSEAPWHVAIYDGVSFICSGSFVSSRSVITTASCVYELNPAYLSVRYGSTDRYGPQMIRVERILAHYYFYPNSPDYNIAILHLESPFDWTNTSASLVDVTSSPLSDNYYVTLTGWGKNTAYSSSLSSSLLKGDFRLWSIYGTYFGIDSSSYSVCLGDGGGPVTQLGKLMGIAQSLNNCNTANSGYTYYITYLYPLLDWILDNSANPK